MSGYPDDGSISAALHAMVAGILSGIHTCMPAVVESYEYAKQRASVKPVLTRAYKDGTLATFPVITNVPVLFPRAGTASLTFPVAKGDTVLCLFSERSLDLYLANGDTSEINAERQFDLSDAIAIPGIFPFTGSSYAHNNTDVELNYGSQRITLKQNGDIELGSSANIKLAASTGDITLGTAALKSLMTKAAMDAFNSHTHTIVPPVPPVVIPTLTNTPVVPMVEATHCTTKVKAQ